MTTPPHPFDFTGKRVLVTGASRGIGYGVAEAFAAAGAELTILAEDAEVAEAAAVLASACGRRVAAVRCDITDRAAVASAITGVGPLDVLVNNAGLELITPILDEDAQVEADYRRVMDINVNGSFWVTREAVKHMGSGAKIVFTASVWGRVGEAGFGAYVASKHAVIGLVRTLAKELGPRSINVNAVCPGWVKTVASMRSLRRMSERTGVSEERLMQQILGGQSLPGLMEPADVAPLYLFLASGAARNITGQAVHVDRGEVMA